MILQTSDAKLKTAIDKLYRFLPLHTADISLTVTVRWQPEGGPMAWQRENGGLVLSCARLCDALALLGRALTQHDRSTETLEPRFDGLGAMVDVSRNSVYTPAALKRFFCQLALLGYTRCYLYMEDTYELPGYPYFGYRRGRYSAEELRDLDDFAAALGLELIPAIQTLAHLRTALRWQYLDGVRDTPDNLMVGEEGTLALVEAMLAHLSRTFRSRRIHLGMDEAVGLGTGRYRLHKGWRDHRELIREHLASVCALCEKYGLEPMIWDDMLFRDHTPRMDYYGPGEPVTQEQKAALPQNLRFVYWDYYHDEAADYAAQLARRGCLEVVFAGGVWKWGGWAPNFTKSFTDAQAAVAACSEKGVRDVMVTLWGDDGDETPLATVLPGLALYGLLRFGSAFPAQTDGFCRLLGGAPLAAFEAMEKLDLIPDRPGPNLEALIPHKLLLYGDIASELFQPSITKEPARLSAHYAGLKEEYSALAQQTVEPHLAGIFAMYAALADFLALRCAASRALHDAWQKKQRKALAAAAQDLEALARKAEALNAAAVTVWSAECKGQGLEVLNLRLGGLAGRCRALRQRLELWERGELDTLTELDEAFLPYSGLLAADGETPGREAYGEIVTANTLCHQFSI